MFIISCCACCLIVKLVRNKRCRNGRVPEIIDEEEYSPDVALLDPEQPVSDTAPSTYNQIECPPNTSEEDSSVLAPPPQPLPP